MKGMVGRQGGVGKQGLDLASGSGTGASHQGSETVLRAALLSDRC